MTETALNSLAQEYVDLTICKTRYDEWDLYWLTEGPFWRRTSMRFSRDYKIFPDYEVGLLKHGRTLQDILEESARLLENLEQYKKTAPEIQMQRVNYLIDHVGHLHTRTRMLLGEHIPFNEMTRQLYCLVAPEYDYKKFDDILEELGQALPGTGTSKEKVLAFQEKLMIPRDRLLAVMRQTTQVFHDIAVARMDISHNNMPRVRVRELPDENMAFLSILFGYEYDRIEYERNFNLKYPWTVDRVVECIGHEMEPGHLTYFEMRLKTMIDTCWPEMGVISQYSSSSAFTEGSARRSVYMSFDNSMDKLVDFEREVVFDLAGLDKGLAQLMPLWHRYCDISGYGKLEATRNTWDGKWSKEEAGAFLEKYAFALPGTGVDALEHLAVDDGHFVAHDYARDVLRDYFDSVTTDVDQQWKLYQRLCASHMSMKEIQDKTFRPVAYDFLP